MECFEHDRHNSTKQLIDTFLEVGIEHIEMEFKRVFEHLMTYKLQL